MHIISAASIEDFTCLVFLSAHSLLVPHISFSCYLHCRFHFVSLLMSFQLLTSQIPFQLLLPLEILFCHHRLHFTWYKHRRFHCSCYIPQTFLVCLLLSYGCFSSLAKFLFHCTYHFSCYLHCTFHFSWYFHWGLCFLPYFPRGFYCSCYVHHRLHFRKDFLLQSYISFLLYTSIHIFIFNCYLHWAALISIPASIEFLLFLSPISSHLFL